MKFKPINLDNVSCYPIKNRHSKVNIEHMAIPWTQGSTFGEWLNRLPNILGAKDIIDVSDRIAKAVKNNKIVILAMGAHVIKVGLGPVIIDLMKRGIVHGIAMNGACIIHDTELAMIGSTSEDVASEIVSGTFGMAEETGHFLNDAAKYGAKENLGLGEAVGKQIADSTFAHKDKSIVGSAYELGIPVTVHVAIGTDIVHGHPGADGGSIGKTSHHDFKVFASLVSSLEKGVFINLGSAVLIPEVFLKALSVVRNLGYNVRDFTTLNMDFIRHYRPMTNVVNRPTSEGGKGFFLLGHHEIMFPLLVAAIIEKLSDKTNS